VNVRWHTVNQPARKLVRKKDTTGTTTAASDSESPVANPAASHSEAVDGDRREVQVAVAEELQVVQGGTRNLRPRRARNLENT